MEKCVNISCAHLRGKQGKMADFGPKLVKTTKNREFFICKIGSKRWQNALVLVALIYGGNRVK